MQVAEAKEQQPVGSPGRWLGIGKTAAAGARAGGAQAAASGGCTGDDLKMSSTMLVTASEGNQVSELEGRPALDVCPDRAAAAAAARADAQEFTRSGAPVAGFYTYGEIARTRGISAFHNQTLVVSAVG